MSAFPIKHLNIESLVVNPAADEPILTVNSNTFILAPGTDTFIGLDVGSVATGNDNTIVGCLSGSSLTTGSGNTILGHASGSNMTTSSNNVVIGNALGASLITGSNNVYVSNSGIGNESNTIRVGSNQTSCYVAGVRGTTTGQAAIPVLVDTNGQLGTVSSSVKTKNSIEPLNLQRRQIYGLRPVQFKYNDRGDALHYGFIAEEVNELLPNLVVRNQEGEIETIAYHELYAPIIAAIQDLNERLMKLEN